MPHRELPSSLPRPLLAFGLPALAVLALGAARARTVEAPPRQDEAEHEETELEGHMEEVEAAMKLLRRSLRDPAESARSLELVAEIQAATVAAKSLTPSMAEGMPEADRITFVAEYRRTMIEFLSAQLELERAVLDGDAEEAKAAYGRVHDMEDTGHERFTEDE